MKREYTEVVNGKRIVYVRETTSAPGSYQERAIRVCIDWNALINRMGARAVNSKTGKCSGLSGIIVVNEVR